MQRFSPWPALLAGALLVSGIGRLRPMARRQTIPPPSSGLPTRCSPKDPTRSEAGRFEEGVRLTLAGLEQPTAPRDQAAGHSNVCAGYAALKRWNEALEHCNRALELDRNNWRTYNNRAAVFVGLKSSIWR